MQVLLTFCIGIIAGNITGLIGASGVMVVVPAFILLGYSPVSSIGASLFIDTIASFIVAWTYYQHKNLVFRDGIWIAAGSIAGAQIGSLFSTRIPSFGLGQSFTIFLLISALGLWINGEKDLVSEEGVLIKNENIQKGIQFLRSYPRRIGLALGLIVGVISGFFGAGGGIMILLILIFVMGFSMHEGIGTSTLIMAFTAASGTLGHLVTGDVPIKIAVFGTMGTVIGGRISAKYANRINERVLSKVGAILFTLLSVIMFFINRKMGKSIPG